MLEWKSNFNFIILFRWDDNFDQLFDYRSKDIFPLGWCDLYGYRLEQPKEETGTQPPKKKKRSKWFVGGRHFEIVKGNTTSPS